MLNLETERNLFVSNSDPDSPFVPSPTPYGNHVLYGHEEMEIHCRVSDPNANVTLINVDTQQPVPCVYDSKRGALGIFTAGTYMCKAHINGEDHYSEEYIVHGSTGVCPGHQVGKRHHDIQICGFFFLHNDTDILTSSSVVSQGPGCMWSWQPRGLLCWWETPSQSTVWLGGLRFWMITGNILENWWAHTSS